MSTKKRRISMRWTLFIILAVFILVTLGVIWFFQVKMLHRFYINTRFSELEETGERLGAVCHLSEEREALVYSRAEDTRSEISLFIIQNQRADLLVRKQGGEDFRIPPLSGADVSALYREVKERDGAYFGTYLFDMTDGLPASSIQGGERKDAQRVAVGRWNDGAVSAVSAHVFVRDGAEYLVIQTAELEPLQATVTTLQRQFLWIGILLLVLALILAVLLSRVLTKPITRVNESAKNLARGRYDVSFPTKGYREISELAGTLNFASSELGKTDSLRRELIANVSHDLRTPLTMIRGYGEVMRDIPGENTPENVQLIIDETTRLSELVNDILDISRIQSGTRPVQKDLFCLTDMIKDTMVRYERLIDSEGYRITFLSEGDAYVEADRGMLLQVVYNLVNNAVHYTGEDRSVTVKQTTADQRVRVSVTDTGAGIPKEELPFIWERYHRGNEVHQRSVVGSGLGLSIVKEILDLHGARYGVKSTLGVGSEFWFELPAKDGYDHMREGGIEE